jgi:hypothetical protein
MLNDSSSILLARLTEVEKIQLRAASPGRLEWLLNNIYKHELHLPHDEALVALTEIKRQLEMKFSADGAKSGFGLTWAF